MSEKFDPFVAEWTSFATSPKYSLVEKCLKLSQLLEYPNLNFNDYIQKINDVGKSLQLSITNIDNPTYRISMLNEHFFHRYGFKGDADDYYNPKNNFLVRELAEMMRTLALAYPEYRVIAKRVRIVNTKKGETGFVSHF
ncbi:MAG: transglutaminase family protein, partial [Thermoproteota archaeon]